VSATALTDEGAPDLAAELALPQPTLFDPPAELTPAPDGTPVETDPGLQKRPRDLDLPPWLKGRYGTAVGSAVHGVLQVIDLATGDDLDALVAAQCQAEAVPERSDDVRDLVLAALGSPSVREAAASRHWREVYACTPIGDRLLEGYLDLLYRGPQGLVVVDHKTAATDDPADLDRRVEGYRLQGAAYALAIGRATGEPVVRVTFTFLTPSGAIERHLPDLPAATAEVERLVADGAELVVP
jgi:ATP-dependent helicase/nuclease subunit A